MNRQSDKKYENPATSNRPGGLTCYSSFVSLNVFKKPGRHDRLRPFRPFVGGSSAATIAWTKGSRVSVRGAHILRKLQSQRTYLVEDIFETFLGEDVALHVHHRTKLLGYILAHGRVSSGLGW